MTDEEKNKVEEIVNQKIREDLPVQKIRVLADKALLEHSKKLPSRAIKQPLMAVMFTLMLLTIHEIQRSLKVTSISLVLIKMLNKKRDKFLNSF
jgi:hypothetical protein